MKNFVATQERGKVYFAIHSYLEDVFEIETISELDEIVKKKMEESSPVGTSPRYFVCNYIPIGSITGECRCGRKESGFGETCMHYTSRDQDTATFYWKLKRLEECIFVICNSS